MESFDHFSFTVPVIETVRLRLRRHRLADYADCSAMWADHAVIRYVGGKPLSGEEVWARLIRYVGHWALLGFGFWAVEEKETGSFVGDLGFMNFQRDIEPSLEGTPEIGWILSSKAHGKGYATEAVRAAVAWGEQHFGAKRTACIIHPDNSASIRVAEKCGYAGAINATYKGSRILMFLRSSAQSQRRPPTSSAD
jgi:RimJ/RimL family protein N-acetyltransferase